MLIDGIEIEVIRKKIKNIYFRVKNETGKVIVTIPYNYDISDLQRIVNKNLSWIKNKLAEQKPDNRMLENNATVYLWGVEKTLRIKTLNSKQPGSLYVASKDNRPRNGVSQSKTALFGRRSSALKFLNFNADIYNKIYSAENEIIIETDADLSHDQLTRLLNLWHKSLLIPRVQELLLFWQKKMNLPPIKFKIRHMKSRWGSCIPGKRSINLNSDLATKPEICLELIIVHELCHFFSQKHDSVFYSYMDNFYPEWKKFDTLLKNSPSNPQ